MVTHLPSQWCEIVSGQMIGKGDQGILRWADWASSPAHENPSHAFSFPSVLPVPCILQWIRIACVFQYLVVGACYSLAACLLAPAFNFVFLYLPYWCILVLDPCSSRRLPSAQRLVGSNRAQALLGVFLGVLPYNLYIYIIYYVYIAKNAEYIQATVPLGIKLQYTHRKSWQRQMV